ncbi:MAG TPA: efflux RND transporter periplasmic adaptor subunit [Phycisphaerae bacterium]|nr:efflux RND transporter periplasmic adaptor subunit [Phycisphaerae bacterium]
MSAPRNPDRPGAAAGRVVPKVLVGVVLLAAVGFVVVVAVLPAPANKAPAKAILPVNVQVLTVEPIPRMDDTIVLPGTIEPNTVVQVAAEVAGRIEQLPSPEGRPCQAGDVLVRLNTDLLQAELDRTKARLDFDKRERVRMYDLRDRGVATDNEVDQARTQEAASQAAYDVTRAQLDRATIVAPTSGVLNRLPEERGEYVTAGTVVAEIVDIDTVLAVVDVPERDIRYLKRGQPATIRDESLDGNALTGTVRYLSELAEERSRTTRVEIAVDNRRRVLRSGQIVTVELSRRTLQDVTMVPLDAVIPLEDGYRVYVVESGKAVPRTVTLGFFKGRRVRVLSGLKPGERLITVGQYYVGPGQAVTVRPDPAASQPAGRPSTAPSQPASAPAARPGAAGAGVRP